MNARITDLVLELSRRCRASEEKIMNAAGLTPAEYLGLSVIDPAGEMSCRDLSSIMGLSPSRGSRVIRKLAEKGFLSAREGKDRRYLIVALAEKGKSTRQLIERLKNDCEKKIGKKLTAKRRAIVTESINGLLEVI